MSQEARALEPVEQKQVAFYGDELTAVRANDGHIYVAIGQMCDALDIDTQAQTRRIQRHTILDEGFKGVAKLATPGGEQRAAATRRSLPPTKSGWRRLRARWAIPGGTSRRNRRARSARR